MILKKPSKTKMLKILFALIFFLLLPNLTLDCIGHSYEQTDSIVNRHCHCKTYISMFSGSTLIHSYIYVLTATDTSLFIKTLIDYPINFIIFPLLIIVSYYLSNIIIEKTRIKEYFNIRMFFDVFLFVVIIMATAYEVDKVYDNPCTRIVCRYNDCYSPQFQETLFDIISTSLMSAFVICISYLSISKYPKVKYLRISLIVMTVLSLAVLFSDVEWQILGSSICDYTNKDKDTCYFHAATAKEDTLICDKMHNQNNIDSCYTYVALGKNDISVCNRIESQEIKNICYSYVISTGKVDMSMCEKVQDIPQGPRYRCYNAVASQTGDLSICDLIDNQDYKYYCYNSVAAVRKDPAICEMVEGQEKKDSCYSKVAVSKNDILICDRIQYQSYKDGCYESIARSVKDALICEKIQDFDREGKCIKDIAIHKKDLSICEMIESQEEKDICYRFVVPFYEDI